MKPYQLSTVLFLFAHPIHSADLASRCPADQLCLTSFKQCDNDYDEGCQVPPESYPWTSSDGSGRILALLANSSYNVSWVFGPQGQKNIPVRIQWKMTGIVWDTNTTESEYLFNPGNILASFPTCIAPNTTSENAWFYASQNTENVLILSQPEAAGIEDKFSEITSQRFTVQPEFTRNYIEAQIHTARQTEYNKWRSGVSIGLGIGIPFLVIATGFVVMALSKRQRNKPQGEVHDTIHDGNSLF
ncbi:hypothetical protein F4777DRAFT_576492 [Nemania sp. FL0916]|nr:hypothetical protein F4777DRAFT_576492 [Nemania sp. FL0916]